VTKPLGPDVALEEARRVLDSVDLCECGHTFDEHLSGGACDYRDGSDRCCCEEHVSVAFVVTRKEPRRS